MTKEECKDLARFDRRQKHSDNKWLRGTKKHPGGHICVGTGDEAEQRGMGKPFGKTPRRRQAKTQKAGNTKLPSLAKEIGLCRRRFGLSDWRIRGEWVTLPDRDDAWVVMQHNLRSATIYIQHRMANKPGEIHEAIDHECVHISLAAIHQAVDNLTKGDKHGHFEECIDTGVERLADTILRLERYAATLRGAMVLREKERGTRRGDA